VIFTYKLMFNYKLFINDSIEKEKKKTIKRNNFSHHSLIFTTFKLIISFK